MEGRRDGDREPRGGRNRLRAAHLRRAARGARPLDRVSLQSHPRLEGARRRHGEVRGELMTNGRAIVPTSVLAIVLMIVPSIVAAQKPLGIGRVATAEDIAKIDI